MANLNGSVASGVIGSAPPFVGFERHATPRDFDTSGGGTVTAAGSLGFVRGGFQSDSGETPDAEIIPLSVFNQGFD